MGVRPDGELRVRDLCELRHRSASVRGPRRRLRVYQVRTTGRRGAAWCRSPVKPHAEPGETGFESPQLHEVTSDRWKSRQVRESAIPCGELKLLSPKSGRFDLGWRATALLVQDRTRLGGAHPSPVAPGDRAEGPGRAGPLADHCRGLRRFTCWTRYGHCSAHMGTIVVIQEYRTSLKTETRGDRTC